MIWQRHVDYKGRVLVKVKSFPEPQGPWGGADLRFLSPQPDTSRSRNTTDTGPVYRVVCPFTPQLSLVLINRPRRDGTLSWRWYTAAKGGIRTRDLAVASSAPSTVLQTWIVDSIQFFVCAISYAVAFISSSLLFCNLANNVTLSVFLYDDLCSSCPRTFYKLSCFYFIK